MLISSEFGNPESSLNCSLPNPHNNLANLNERRDGTRHLTSYRPCCVMLGDRVTIGLVRNFSEGGVKLEMDLDCEVGDQISYFWEPSELIRSVVVWRKGRIYGLQHLELFSKNVSAKPVRSVRVPCGAEVECWIGGERHFAEVHNISLGGMRVTELPRCKLGALVALNFCGIEVGSASIRWADGASTGIQFDKRLTREALAQLFLDERLLPKSIEFEKASYRA